MLNKKTIRFATQSRNRHYVSRDTRAKTDVNAFGKAGKARGARMSHSQPLTTGLTAGLTSLPAEGLGHMYPDVELSFREAAHKALWDDKGPMLTICSCYLM